MRAMFLTKIIFDELMDGQEPDIRWNLGKAIQDLQTLSASVATSIALRTKKTAAAMLYLYPTRCRSFDIPAIFAFPGVIRFEDEKMCCLNIQHEN